MCKTHRCVSPTVVTLHRLFGAEIFLNSLLTQWGRGGNAPCREGVSLLFWTQSAKYLPSKLTRPQSLFPLGVGWVGGWRQLCFKEKLPGCVVFVCIGNYSRAYCSLVFVSAPRLQPIKSISLFPFFFLRIVKCFEENNRRISSLITIHQMLILHAEALLLPHKHFFDECNPHFFPLLWILIIQFVLVT